MEYSRPLVGEFMKVYTHTDKYKWNRIA